jgi:hypothetical protein
MVIPIRFHLASAGRAAIENTLEYLIVNEVFQFGKERASKKELPSIFSYSHSVVRMPLLSDSYNVKKIDGKRIRPECS